MWFQLLRSDSFFDFQAENVAELQESAVGFENYGPIARTHRKIVTRHMDFSVLFIYWAFQFGITRSFVIMLLA